jgi:cytochrome P450
MARPSQGLPPFDPNDRGLNSDPWPVYRRYRAQDPVHWGTSVNPQLDGAWYVFGFEDCKNILLNPAFPINPASVGMEENFPPAFKPAVEIFDQWLGATDAPDHAALRKLMNQGFTAKSIQAMVPRIEELAQHLVDEALGIDGGQFDFVDTVAFPLPIIVICELLGVPTSDRMMFRDLSQQFLAAVHKPGDEVLATAGSAAAVALLE